MAHEFDGRKYGNVSAHQKAWGSKLISELSLTGTEHVLDLGCGDGAVTALVAEALPTGQVVGIDASRGMIDAAGGRAGNNLRFILMDIDDMAFEETFDLIFSNAALHWVKDHRRMLASAHRALRPGGRLRCNFAGAGNCSHFFKVVQQIMKHKDFKHRFETFTWPWYMPEVKEYTNLVDDSPFQEATVWGENADRHFPDTRAMIGWIDQPSLVPFLPCLSDAEKPRFRQRVIDAMVKETEEEDGRCFETFRRINFSARK